MKRSKFTRSRVSSPTVRTDLNLSSDSEVPTKTQVNIRLKVPQTLLSLEISKLL